MKFAEIYVSPDLSVTGKGLSSYAKTPSEAGSSLQKCLDTAEEKIPWLLKKYTPVYIGATAGMRLLR